MRLVTAVKLSGIRIGGWCGPGPECMEKTRDLLERQRRAPVCMNILETLVEGLRVLWPALPGLPQHLPRFLPDWRTG